MNPQPQEPQSAVIVSERFTRNDERDLPAVHQPSAGNAASLMVAIERVISNPNMDIGKMERVFAMHQQVVAQEREAAFNAAMARAQANIQPVVNNAFNTHTKSHYATLSKINERVMPVITAEGLSISFDSADSPHPGMLRVVAIVSHREGHSRQYHLDMPLDDAGSGGKVNKTKVQATGSTNMYARRYLVNLIFNIASQADPEDKTDGNREEEREPEIKTMPEETYKEWVAKIKAATTKAAAKTVWKEAIKAVEELGDRSTGEKLTADLVAHGAFIDQADQATAK